MIASRKTSTCRAIPGATWISNEPSPSPTLAPSESFSRTPAWTNSRSVEGVERSALASVAVLLLAFTKVIPSECAPNNSIVSRDAAPHNRRSELS